MIPKPKIVDFIVVLAAAMAFITFLMFIAGVTGCSTQNHVTIPTPPVVYPQSTDLPCATPATAPARK